MKKSEALCFFSWALAKKPYPSTNATITDHLPQLDADQQFNKKKVFLAKKKKTQSQISCIIYFVKVHSHLCGDRRFSALKKCWSAQGHTELFFYVPCSHWSTCSFYALEPRSGA